MTRVLVVEDEPKAAAYLRQGLSEAGFVVDVAADGDAGLAAARGDDYALVLCDVALPRRDGLSLVAGVRTAVDTTDESSSLHTWRSPSGRVWRVVEGPRDAAGRWIELARGRWTDERVLTNYALGRRMGAVDPRALGHALDGPRRIDRIPDAPAEVQTLAASFDAMLARLEEAFAALSQFSAELAHEFRTPLHILRQHARDRRWRPVAAAGRRGTTLRSAAALRRLWA